MIRLFLPLLPNPGETVQVDGERFHYLAHVLRLGADSTLEVFDGHGLRYPARVTTVFEDGAELSLGAAVASPPRRSITLVQGLPKADKLELILQKGTELDASAFWPVACERSVVRLDAARASGKLERWRRIVEEAARQCGRSEVPEVREPTTLLEAMGQLEATATVLVLDEEERALPLSQAAGVREAEGPLVIVVGPEGGLTRPEVRALVELGAQPVTLGALVLRTETASLAALSVLRHLEGTLG